MINLKMAVALLKKGELIAFPTETVYGLGALLSHSKAIEKIYLVKGRDQKKPLIVHISHMSDLERLTEDRPAEFYKLAKAFFPGPLTLVLKAKKGIIPWETIAIRMPSHPIAKRLIELAGPLVATSANLSGRRSGITVAHVLEDLKGKIAGVIDGGEATLGIASTVLDLTSEKPKILREGAISQEQINQVLS